MTLVFFPSEFFFLFLFFLCFSPHSRRTRANNRGTLNHYTKRPLLRDSIAEGGIAPICLVFIGYRARIAETPLLWAGVSPLHFACSPTGKRSEKGEGVPHPVGHVETPKTP